jgi:hypothetical protein
MEPQTKPKQEAVMLLHTSAGKFGNNVELETSKQGVEEFKKLITNINLNKKENE